MKNTNLLLLAFISIIFSACKNDSNKQKNEVKTESILEEKDSLDVISEEQEKDLANA